MRSLTPLMLDTISILYIYMGTEVEKIPSYAGYEDVVRRKITRRGEEEGRKSTLASSHVY